MVVTDADVIERVHARIRPDSLRPDRRLVTLRLKAADDLLRKRVRERRRGLKRQIFDKAALRDPELVVLAETSSTVKREVECYGILTLSASHQRSQERHQRTRPASGVGGTQVLQPRHVARSCARRSSLHADLRHGFGRHERRRLSQRVGRCPVVGVASFGAVPDH